MRTFEQYLKEEDGSLSIEGYESMMDQSREDIKNRKLHPAVVARQSLEKRVISRLVKDALAKNYTVSLNDGEEWTVKRSRNYEEIMGAIMTTDEDFLRIRDEKGESVGSVTLIYGNDGWDVIADWSWRVDKEKGVDTEAQMNDLMKGADELANKLDG